jgi:hypothetical protein
MVENLVDIRAATDWEELGDGVMDSRTEIFDSRATKLDWLEGLRWLHKSHTRSVQSRLLFSLHVCDGQLYFGR